MDIRHEAGFLKSEQVNLREVTLLIQAHTLSGIFTANITNIKDGIFEGILDNWK